MIYNPVKSSASFLCSPYHDSKEWSFSRENKEGDVFIFIKAVTQSYRAEVLPLSNERRGGGKGSTDLVSIVIFCCHFSVGFVPAPTQTKKSTKPLCIHLVFPRAKWQGSISNRQFACGHPVFHHMETLWAKWVGLQGREQPLAHISISTVAWSSPLLKHPQMWQDNMQSQPGTIRFRSLPAWDTLTSIALRKVLTHSQLLN